MDPIRSDVIGSVSGDAQVDQSPLANQMTSAPSGGRRLGLLILSYEGGELTKQCLQHLATLPDTKRCQVVLVDNGSTDGVADWTRNELPWVTVLQTGRNLGYAGGNNVGLRWLLARDEIDAIALLNNDAFPSPGWLAPLEQALDDDERIGAAAPKILLGRDRVTLHLETSPSHSPGDPRAFGVMLHAVRTAQSSIPLLALDGQDGLWGIEYNDAGAFSWTKPDCTLQLEVSHPEEEGPVEIQVSSPHGAKRVLFEQATHDCETEIGSTPEWVRVPGPIYPRPIINSAGTTLLATGEVADRGYLQADDPSFGQAEETFGWSGAAVLLRRRYLEEVGLFDPRYFLYYEDAELAWRGRRLGWTYAYEPRSVVRHLHSATVGKGSALVRHLHARNRLVLLTDVGPRNLLAQGLREHGKHLRGELWRDVLRPVTRGHRPEYGHVARRTKVLAGWLKLVPGSLAKRRRLRRRQTVSDGEINAWLTTDHGERTSGP